MDGGHPGRNAVKKPDAAGINAVKVKGRQCGLTRPGFVHLQDGVSEQDNVRIRASVAPCCKGRKAQPL
jgi:hypothetical protein